MAYTGGITVAAGGGRTRVPAGACWIDQHAATPAMCNIRWSERGIEYTVQLPSDELRGYVAGCIVQYA